LFCFFSLLTIGSLIVGLVYLSIIHNTAAPFDFDNAPITHCINVKDHNNIHNKTMQSFDLKNQMFFLSMLQYCSPQSCKKVVAICEMHFPLQDLISFVLWAVFFAITCGSIFFLSRMRSFGKVYILTKRYYRPVVHYSFLQDRLEDPTKGMALMERLQLIREACALDPKVINRQGNENSPILEGIFKNAQKSYKRLQFEHLFMTKLL